jgi:glycosyltransferase involved in cell wall biosynthesis
MKILILSTSHPYKTAGIVALDLYNGLKEIEGNEVKMAVKIWDNYQDINIIPIETHFQHFKAIIARKVRHLFEIINFFKSKKILLNPDYYIQDYDQTISNYSTEKILKKIDFIPDAIIVLFTQNFLSYKNINELNLKTKAPIYQYLMDMATFTGGCHYAWQCRGYTLECGKCPGLFSKDPQDQTNINWKFKREYIKNTNVIIVAATGWQLKQINQSSLFEHKKKVKIFSPTNSELFCTSDKLLARGRLKIPINKKVIFWAAIYPNEKRKGYKESIESLKLLYNRLPKNDLDNVLIMVAGESDKGFLEGISFEVYHLGYLDHSILAIAYQAADLFLNASIEDSGPTMINQAIMSGTPVVAFEMGVAPDLVLSGVTGYLAKLYDTYDLCDGIISILNLSQVEYKKMSANCRDLALKTCSNHKVAQEFQILMENRINLG